MKNYTRVYITGSVYNLFFNLLITPEEELETSYFITCETIHESIRKNLKNNLYIPDMFHIGRMRKLEYIMRFQYFSRFYYPFLSGVKWYVQDHLPYTPLVLGHRHYVFTEDGPTGFKSWEDQESVLRAWKSKEKSNEQGFLRRIKSDFFNPLGGGIFANNNQCDELMLTSDYVPPFASDKKLTLVNLEEEWNTSSENKRNLILDVFNITIDDINMLKSKKVILFTQPFFEDGDVPTREDHINIYKDVLSKYNPQNVIIKTHPRETMDYKSVFPEIEVFNKPTPFQLLALAGIKFEEAATVCSSSVLGIPYPIKINWVGAKIHPDLLREYGNYIPEELKEK